MPEDHVTAEQDRNLLSGLLAYHAGIVSAEQLAGALRAWVDGPDKDLVEHLSSAANLSGKERSLLVSLVEAAVERHAGDATLSLASIDGARQIGRIVAQTAAGDMAARLSDTLMLPRDFMEEELESLAAVEEAPGRYSRTSEYSRGGMGRIMLVHDQCIGRDIALKELLPFGKTEDSMLGELSSAGEGAVTLRRFLHEARLTGRLEHPSIVPVYELGRSSTGSYYYTMKLVRGKTLSQALKGGATLEERLRFLPHFLDLCHAIAYAHSRGVIHRDIKPANVMVGSFGETVVIDWGLAKVKGKEDLRKEDLRPRRAGCGEAEDGDSTATAAGVPVGTPVYMPPEQAEGRIDDVDERSDVYSLGAVLYVLLTGRSPFSGGSAEDVMRRVIHEEPVPVRTLEPQVPVELAGICHKALRKDPSARYQSAQELAEEIERYQSGALVHSYDYGLTEMAWRFYTAHKAVLRTAGVCGALLLCLGIYSYVSVYQARNRERMERIAAEQAQQVAVEAREQENAAREAAEHSAYVAQIRLAAELLDNDDYEHAREVLWKTNEGLRNCEWGHLLNRSHPEYLKLPDCRWGGYSPDGSTVMLLSMNGIVQTWDLATRAPLAAFPARTDHTPAYSPDGSRIITTLGREAIVRDSRTGAELLRVSGDDGEMRTGAFSPDGARIVTASDEGKVWVWDAQSGDCLRVLSGEVGTVHSAVFALDGSRVLTLGANGPDMWDMNTGERLFSLEGHCPECSRDGRRIVTWLEREARVWDAASGECVLRVTPGGYALCAAHISPDGQRVLTATADGIVRLWDTRTGSESRKLEHGKDLRDAMYDPSGNSVATISGDGRIKVWRPETGEELMDARAHRSDITNVSFSPDGARMLTVGRDDKARVWSLCAFPDRPVSKEYQKAIAGLDFSRDGRRCAVVTEDGHTRILDAETEQELVSFCVFTPAGMRLPMAKCVSFDPVSERVAAVQDSFAVIVYDVAAGTLVSLMTGHQGEITSIAYSPDGARLVSGSWDNTARIWDARTGESEVLLRGHLDSVLGVAWAGDGSRILTTSADGTAKVWDAQKGEELHTLTGHAGQVLAGVFSPDGRWIATGSEDETARIWDAESGAEIGRLTGHTKAVTGVVFSPDGKRIASFGADGTTRLWDSVSGDGLIPLPKASGGLTALAFSPDGGRILLGTRHGSVRVCEAAPWRCEDLPGGEDAQWQERYRLYKETRLDAARDPQPSGSPARMTIVTTAETLRERMERLREALLNEADSSGWFVEGGLEVHAGPCAQAMARLCLKPGDRIVRIGKIETASQQRAIEALEAALKAFEGTQGTRLEMELIREDRRTAVLFEGVKRQVAQRRLVFPRDKALSMIRLEHAMMLAGTDVMLEVGQKNAEAMGEPAQGVRALRGIWVPGTGDPAKKALCLAVELAPYERVLRMNGHAITCVDDAIREYDGVIRALEAGEPCTLSIDSERGEFQLTERQIVVE